MDNLILLNNVVYDTMETLEKYDYKLTNENYKLNRFKKSEIQAELTIELIDKIKEHLRKYLNQQYEKEKTDKFGFKAKFKNISELKCIKKKILIDEYCYCLERLTELNSELYNMTELYENERMLDFNHELFNIFKNKLGYYTKLRNTIKQLY